MLATPVRVDIIVFMWEWKLQSRYFEAAKSRCTEGRLHVSLLINRHTHARAELTPHEAYTFLTECLKTSVFTMGSQTLTSLTCCALVNENTEFRG